MPDMTGPLPPTIKLLSEHLDMVLAAGEDLCGLSFDAREVCADGIPGGRDAPSISAFVREVQTLELAAAMRVQSARARAEELAAQDDRFRLIVALFIGGTNVLADATAALAKPGGDDFHTAGCPVTYLQSRAVIPDDQPGPSSFSAIQIGPNFRIGGVVELDTLMDLAATFLDTVEIHYEVFPDQDESAVVNRKPTLAEAIAHIRGERMPALRA